MSDLDATTAQPIVTCITVGMFEENCYLFACPQTKEAVIIDPGDEPERILAAIKELQLIPRYILNTHGHIDHICAIDAVSEIYPVPLAIHPADVPMYTDERSAAMFGRKAPLVKRKPDILLHEGDRIISGDTLFYRSIGRTDLPGGNYEQIIASIRTKLYTLEDDLVVFPGHGEPTTIEEEKHENPFVNVEE